jgi:hypothetical protein
MQAVVHGLKVALHIAVAIVVYGVVAYLQHNSLPLYALAFTGVINSVLAGLWKWTQLPIQEMPTIDTAPPQS